MTLTDNELTEATAGLSGGIEPHRQPITDVAVWLDGLDYCAQSGLRALGELLTGLAERADSAENADRFTARCLGVADCAHLLDEDRPLNPVSRLTIAVALAEWINEYADVCEMGPGDRTQPPRWTQTEIGGRRYRHPQCL